MKQSAGLSFGLILLLCLSARADDVASCHLIAEDGAISACQRLIESGWYNYRSNDLAVVYSNLGAAQNAKGDNDNAIKNLNEAIRLDSRLAMAFYNRGLVLQKTKKYDQAIQDFTSAIDIDPKFFKAYKSRGLVWLLKKKPDRAVADLDFAIRTNPNSVPDDYLGRALAKIQLKKYAGAIADIDEAVRLDPQPKTVYFLNRSWARILNKDFDRALPDIDEVLRLDPTNAVALNNRGFIYNKREQFDKALKDLNRAIELDPKNASAYKNRGFSFEKKGDAQKALDDFRKAVSIDASNQEAVDGVKRLAPVATEAFQPTQPSAIAGEQTISASPFDYSGPIPKPGMPADLIVEQAIAFDKWFNDPNRVSPTDVNEALRSMGDQGAKDAQIRASLRSIPRTDAQYAQAQKMLAGFARQDVKTIRQVREAAQKYLTAAADVRRTVAEKIQTNYWEAGLDVTASVSGPRNTILNLRYVLFSNPLVYKLVNAASFTETCRKVGFTKILFTDGYNKQWSYPLSK